jgi:hypothetical protein
LPHHPSIGSPTPKLKPPRELDPKMVDLIADCGMSGMEELQLKVRFV